MSRESPAGVLTITGVGTIEVEACQAGNSDYLPVSPPKCAKHSVVVEKASQSIDIHKSITFTDSGPAKLKATRSAPREPEL